MQLTAVGGPEGNQDGNCRGDANGDGQVDLNDLTAVLYHFGQNEGATWSQGDINDDGKVDLNDLTCILVYYTTPPTTYTSQQMAYVDKNANAVKKLVLYQGTDPTSGAPTETQQTWTVEQAREAVVTDYNGTALGFDIITVSPDTLPANFPDTNNSFGALGWWKLVDGSGSATDSSGLNPPCNGTLSSSGATWTSAPVAVDFDGTGYIVLDDSNLTPQRSLSISGQITIAAWVLIGALPSDTDPHYIVCSGNNTVFLGIHGSGSNSQWQVGDTTSSASLAVSSADIGNWVHLTGVYDGQRWKLYRKGILRSVSDPPPGTYTGANTSGGWVIGANGPTTGPTDGFFTGTVNGVRLYNRALTVSEVRTLAQVPQRAGRLSFIRDRNGYTTKITYTYNPWQGSHTDPLGSNSTVGTMIANDPALQWRINTIQDPSGRTATFDDCATPEAGYTHLASGRWAVSTITLPGATSRSLAYNYRSGTSASAPDYCKLISVDHPDGSQSTFTIAADTTYAGLIDVTFVDPMADGGHTKKTAYYTNQIALYNVNSSNKLWLAEIFNQSSWIVRMLTNDGADGSTPEVTYLNYSATTNGTPPSSPWPTTIYEGQGKLKQIIGAYLSQYYSDWSVNGSTNGFTLATGESTYAKAGTYSSSSDTVSWTPTPAEYNTGTFSAMQDQQGRGYTYTYATGTNANAGNITGRTYYNGPIASANAAGTESWSYDNSKPNHPVASYTDLDSRATYYQYDNNGNLTCKEVGASGQPEHAFYQWDYYGSNESATLPDGVTVVTQPQNFVKKAYYPVATANDKSGDYVLFVYDGQHRLAGVQEPDDTGTGYHWARKYTYQDTAGTPGYGQVLTIKDAVNRVTTYAYDACNRVCSVTYDDTSTEEYLYGANIGRRRRWAPTTRRGSCWPIRTATAT